jgi:hypothetical protein
MRFIHCPDDEGKSAPLKHWSTSTSLNGTISQKADIPSLVTSSLWKRIWQYVGKQEHGEANPILHFPTFKTLIYKISN